MAFGFVVCPGLIRQDIRFDRLILARHPQAGEQVNNAIVIDKEHPLRMQTYKVGAVFAVLVALAGLHAEQVRIRAIGALA